MTIESLNYFINSQFNYAIISVIHLLLFFFYFIVSNNQRDLLSLTFKFLAHESELLFSFFFLNYILPEVS